MPTIRTLMNNSEGYYTISATFNRREKLNIELINALKNDPLDALLPLTSQITPKMSNLKVSLQGLYSVEVRLQDPVSSSEALMLLKGLVDSFSNIMDYGVSADYVVMNLDRVFIKPDGTISWLTWANEAQNNESTLLDLLYTLTEMFKPRSKRDEKFIQAYSELFQQQLNTNEEFLDSILSFINKQYTALEKKIIKEYQEKGNTIEQPGGNSEKVMELNQVIADKDRELTDIKSNLDTLSNGLLAKDEELSSTLTQVSDLKSKNEELEQQIEKLKQVSVVPPQPTQPQPQPYINPKPQFTQPQPTFQSAPVQNTPQFVQAPTQQPQQNPEPSFSKPSITSDLTKYYSEQEDGDEFEIGGETTVLGLDDEDRFVLHLITTGGIDTVITETTTTLGKGKTNDIILKDVAVSGKHARLNFDDLKGEATITDLQSTNGTFINNSRLTASVGVLLSEGDLLRLGRTDFTVHYEK